MEYSIKFNFKRVLATLGLFSPLFSCSMGESDQRAKNAAIFMHGGLGASHITTAAAACELKNLVNNNMDVFMHKRDTCEVPLHSQVDFSYEDIKKLLKDRYSDSFYNNYKTNVTLVGYCIGFGVALDVIKKLRRDSDLKNFDFKLAGVNPINGPVNLGTKLMFKFGEPTILDLINEKIEEDKNSDILDEITPDNTLIIGSRSSNATKTICQKFFLSGGLFAYNPDKEGRLYKFASSVLGWIYGLRGDYKIGDGFTDLKNQFGIFKSKDEYSEEPTNNSDEEGATFPEFRKEKNDEEEHPMKKEYRGYAKCVTIEGDHEDMHRSNKFDYTIGLNCKNVSGGDFHAHLIYNKQRHTEVERNDVWFKGIRKLFGQQFQKNISVQSTFYELMNGCEEKVVYGREYRSIESFPSIRTGTAGEIAKTIWKWMKE